MRLVWDAVGTVDPNMILLIVRVIKTRYKMGVYQISEMYKCTGIYTVHMIVLIPGFYSREDIILILRRRLLTCQVKTHRSVNGKGTI